jgi:hypothetical protein
MTIGRPAPASIKPARPESQGAGADIRPGLRASDVSIVRTTTTTTELAIARATISPVTAADGILYDGAVRVPASALDTIVYLQKDDAAGGCIANDGGREGGAGGRSWADAILWILFPLRAEALFLFAAVRDGTCA